LPLLEPQDNLAYIALQECDFYLDDTVKKGDFMFLLPQDRLGNTWSLSVSHGETCLVGWDEVKEEKEAMEGLFRAAAGALVTFV
jgi:hypothetical protein